MVDIETATVYRAAGRRFLTKSSAYKAEAWAMIKKKYPCECNPGMQDEWGHCISPPDICWRHSQNEKFLEIHSRLVKRLRRRDENKRNSFKELQEPSKHSR